MLLSALIYNGRKTATYIDQQTHFGPFGRWANFSWSAPIYQNALRYSNFDQKLDYTWSKHHKKTCRNRQRNIIWFNPLFSKNVKTNIARNFLCLIDKHFPPNHRLHKIFNRNTVKVSYSCMNNVKSIISKHNIRITGKKQATVWGHRPMHSQGQEHARSRKNAWLKT